MPLDVAAAPKAIHEHNCAALDVERLRADYFSDGCVIIRNAMDPLLLAEMRDRFRHFFAAIIRRESGEAPPDADIDQLHDAAAAAIGPERAQHFLTMGRDFPAFSAIISAPALLSILKGLLQTADLHTIADSNVFRIDRPGSAATNLDWHQDYPYNMLAQSAATAWIPINPVTQGMGRPRVAPGIQTILPIEYNLSAKAQFHNSRYIAIQNLAAISDEFEQRAITIPDMNPGDILLLHALCLHRSGHNTSHKARWVATARYGPLMDEQLYARNWFTMRAKYPDIFKHHHPDLFKLIE